MRPDLDLTGLFAPHPGPAVRIAGRTGDGDLVLAVGDGPLACSSSRVLAPRVIVIWDVNGFYAALTVSPTAGRGELASSYVRLNGAASSYLTMVLRILLDRAQRRVYDSLVPGQRFKDPQTVYEMRRAELRRNGNARTETPETLYEMAERTPYLEQPDPDQAPGTLPEPDADPDVPWGYAHYLMGTPGAPETGLAAWQQLIIAALDDGGAPLCFAVGYARPGTEPVVAVLGAVPAAFLPYGTAPTEHLAHDAAHRLRHSAGDRPPANSTHQHPTATRSNHPHRGEPDQ